jgi:nitroreductase
MSKTRANAITTVDDIIAERWSPRSFEACKPVEQDKLHACLEAARWAPSCFGDEPWRFIVCNRFVDVGTWEKLLDCLTPKNQSWAKNASVLLLACADSVFRSNGKTNRWAQYDTGQAAMSLCLQATALGLASHQMGGFDMNRARAEFGIPDQFTPMAAIALGYQAGIDTLDEGFHGVETGERWRQPLGDCFFAGGWNKPII